jgi:hypothetical protein
MREQNINCIGIYKSYKSNNPGGWGVLKIGRYYYYHDLYIYKRKKKRVNVVWENLFLNNLISIVKLFKNKKRKKMLSK